jgi:SAM-dependent methyltransferase
LLTKFLHLSQRHINPRCLEVGTRRQGDRPTWKKPHFAEAHPLGEFVGVDFEPGADVDVVADAHALPFEAGSFNLALCCSTLEHVRRPWLVAAELARVLRPGGLLYVQTHQTFPVHGYPQDFYRFSREALLDLFGADAGMEAVECGYEFPCRIMPLENYFPHAKDWNFEALAWLNVEGIFRRLP